MFPKHQRLTAGQVKEIIGSTKPRYLDFLKTYHAAPVQAVEVETGSNQPPTSPFHVAVIVSKHAAKKAYERNRMRRRVSNALREVVRGKTINLPLNLVIIVAKPLDETLSHDQLVSTLDRLFK